MSSRKDIDAEVRRIEEILEEDAYRLPSKDEPARRRSVRFSMSREPMKEKGGE